MKFPATLLPRRQPLRRATAAAQARARLSSPVAIPVTDLAILGMTPADAAAIPGVLDAYGVGAAAGESRQARLGAAQTRKGCEHPLIPFLK